MLAKYLLIANTMIPIDDSKTHFLDDKIVFGIYKNPLERFVLYDTMLRNLPRCLFYLGSSFFFPRKFLFFAVGGGEVGKRTGYHLCTAIVISPIPFFVVLFKSKGLLILFRRPPGG